MSLTSVLDLLGLLLLVACGAVAAGALVGLWAALGVAGLGVLGTSWLLDAVAATRRRAKR